MTEIVGWLAACLSLTGQALAARGHRQGWALRLLSGAGWLWYGLHRHAGPYVAISVCYLAIDSYGYLRRRARKPASLDRHTARRLVIDDRHPHLSEPN